MKNFLILGLVFGFGLIVSTATAQTVETSSQEACASNCNCGRLMSGDTVRRVAQAPAKIRSWVRSNRPVRSTASRIFGRCR